MSGFLARIVNAFTRSENNRYAPNVRMDPGGKAVQDCLRVGSAGDDSSPLDGDYGLMVDLCHTTGTRVFVGSFDPVNEPQAAQGERRLYSRDGEGNIKATVWIKQDGSLVLSNDNGSLELQSNGDIVLNGLTIDTNGNLTTAGEVTAGVASIKLSEHTHGGVETGGGNTGLPQ